MNSKKYMLILLLVNIVLFSSGFSNSNKKAQWLINKSCQNRSNSWVAFKKQFEIKEGFNKATLNIAVDSKYWLWVNDKMVVFEGGLKRGPSPKDTYYDEIDLFKNLNKGKNTISVLVWYFGKDGFSHNSSGKAGLLCELFLDKTLSLVTDESWRSVWHTAYVRNETGAQPNYRLPESNIVFDARRDIDGWYKSDSKVRMGGTMSAGTKGCAPWNKLIKRPIPQWKNYGFKKYNNSLKFPFISDGKKIVCKLPYNCHVTPYLKVKSKAGVKIDIRTDNYKGGGPENLRTEYITKDGVQEYESFGWISGHEMIYDIPEGVEVLDLQYRETGYNTEFVGEFECNDDYLNKLWIKSRRTLYITMRDTYMDCPERERAQWWGDAVNEIGESFYALCPKSHLLAKKGILELMNWQKPDNSIFSPVPAGNYNSELPMQMLNSVGYYGFWNYYLNTGDIETIKEVLPRVRKYLDLWKIKENGLVTERRGGWTWGDWGIHKDMSVLFNTWYYLACKGYALMAKATGKPSEKEWAENNMKTIKESFNKTFWTGREYRSPGYTGETDDRANAMAVVAGLAKPNQYPLIKKVLEKQMYASPYMEKYVMEALFKMGYEKFALKRMKKLYKEMTNSHLTTLWEGWGIGHKGFGGGTYNHAWSGGPLTIFSQYLVGVSPSKVGYEEVSIHPQMADIKQAKLVMESVKGKISVENKVNTKKFTQTIELPESVSLKLYKPRNAKKIKKLLINGKSNRKLLKSLKKKGSFNLKGGKYNIVYKY